MFQHWDRVREMENPAGYLERTAMNVFRSQYRRATMAVRRTIGTAPEQDAFEAIEDRDVATRARDPHAETASGGRAHRGTRVLGRGDRQAWGSNVHGLGAHAKHAARWPKHGVRPMSDFRSAIERALERNDAPFSVDTFHERRLRIDRRRARRGGGGVVVGGLVVLSIIMGLAEPDRPTSATRSPVHRLVAARRVDRRHGCLDQLPSHRGGDRVYVTNSAGKSLGVPDHVSRDSETCRPAWTRIRKASFGYGGRARVTDGLRGSPMDGWSAIHRSVARDVCRTWIARRG